MDELTSDVAPPSEAELREHRETKRWKRQQFSFITLYDDVLYVSIYLPTRKGRPEFQTWLKIVKLALNGRSGVLRSSVSMRVFRKTNYSELSEDTEEELRGLYITAREFVDGQPYISHEGASLSFRAT